MEGPTVELIAEDGKKVNKPSEETLNQIAIDINDKDNKEWDEHNFPSLREININ